MANIVHKLYTTLHNYTNTLYTILHNYTQFYTTLDNFPHFFFKQLCTTLHNFTKSLHNSTKLYNPSQYFTQLFTTPYNSTQLFTILKKKLLQNLFKSTNYSKSYTKSNFTHIYTTLHNVTEFYTNVQHNRQLYQHFTNILQNTTRICLNKLF